MQNQKKKKKVILDKHLPVANIPESKIYTNLQQLEKNIDLVLVRKRLDIQEALSRSPKTTGTLRLYIGNSTFNSESGDVAFSLQIQGKVLNTPPSGSQPRLFSTFFKAMLVEFSSDAVQVPSVEWQKSQQQQPSDGFEIKRTLDGSTAPASLDCKVVLQLDNQPEKYKLSPELARVLNLSCDTKTAVIMTIWQYIKLNRLQDGSDHRVIHADATLSQLFNNITQFTFAQIPELLAPHLLPADPIVINYTLRLDTPIHKAPFVVDVQVELDDPIRANMLRYVMNTTSQKDYALMDQQIVKIVQQIHVHSLKLKFMKAFSKDPVGFLEKWIAAQSRDLETILGENQLNAEWQRRSQFYHEDWTAEAVFHYLSSKATTQ